MQQRRRDRGGIAIWHRLSAISEASDDRATSSADDEEINTSIAEVREFHEQFGRDSGGRSSASHRSGKRFATLMRPQPEGLAGEPLTQRVTQLDEQRDYQPALLGLPGLPA
uniref:CACTA en-spm transposon protein n=1 Tax=Macrostomum lignano TaxID=282301 RepID=A0A1I8JKI1_9PLAT